MVACLSSVERQVKGNGIRSEDLAATKCIVLIAADLHLLETETKGDLHSFIRVRFNETVFEDGFAIDQ